MITWNNKRRGKTNIQQRSDKGLAIDSWCRAFLQAVVHHLDAMSLDHKFLLLIYENLAHFGRKKKQFTFKIRWVDILECE